MKIFKRILLSILGILLFCGGAYAGYTVYNINNVTTHISDNNEDLGIEEDTIDELEKLMAEKNFNKDEIVNIALFGIDTRNADGGGSSRSDSIIVASVDKKHNKIKLSSIMRDTYVSIDGHGKDKINHAYAYGGPQLAIKTINKNFGLDIKEFVTVDFFGLEKIINAIGGVEITVKDYEVKEINKFIEEVAAIEKKKPTLLSSAGTQKLNGMQAVSYGRIRKVGNGDYERTDRQRTVIIAMINKLQDLNLTQALNLANECTSYLKTSLSIPEAAKLGGDVLVNMKGFTIEQERFPKDGKGETINGTWYMTTDIDKTKTQMKNFIYEINSSSKN